MYNRRRYGRRRAPRPTPEPVKPFIGPLRLPDPEWVDSFVRRHVENYTEEQRILRAEIIAWICATGDCLLHAIHEVRVRHHLPSVCYCTTCNPTADITGFGGAIFLTR